MAPPTISSLISSTERGDGPAAAALFAALYAELHRLAQSQLRKSGGGLTIGATTLLHEAYLDMSRRESTVFPDRSRFMAYAAKVMRRLLIDYARGRQAQKRGGAFHITALTDDVSAPLPDAGELARIGAAVDELASLDPELAAIVDLKFFCGFSFAEIGAMRGLSERTVQRQWRKARLYLHTILRDAVVP
jgi:RNA polymerase sigma factor (TIGR02999 family)